MPLKKIGMALQDRAFENVANGHQHTKTTED